LLLNIWWWRRWAEDRDIWRRTTEEARARCGLSRHCRRRICLPFTKTCFMFNVIVVINYIVISSQVLFHSGSLLHYKLNTQLLITVHSSSKNLTPVWQILELQRIPLPSSSFSTGSSALITNYNQQLYNTRLDSTSLLTPLTASKILSYLSHCRNHSNASV
jgi:hypothetical protein